MNIFFILIFVYLLVGVVYFLIFSIAGKLCTTAKFSEGSDFRKIAIVIPAYKEDQIIVDTVRVILDHDYPKENYHVFVMADQLSFETLAVLNRLPVSVHEVVHLQSTKAKSLHAFFEMTKSETFDLVMLLDADNVMQLGCLKKVNNAFIAGSRVVQCHRIAKNNNNALAILDAISEEIRINIFFAGQRAFGLSAELIGSGMAFEYPLLKEILQNTHVQESTGEDKEMTLQLMKQGISVEYLADALVLDEKVSDLQVFKRQRKRWIESQLQIIRSFFRTEFKEVRSKGVFWYRLFQNLLLPRSFYMILLPFITVLSFLLDVFDLKITPEWMWWLSLTFLYFLSLLLSVPISYFNVNTLMAIGKLPRVLISMVWAASSAKMNNKVFVATTKGADKKIN
jgi:cellulose synthase/poly-beta-1,6-N-acetylglucosamine synthase-like glycosyltransferase